MLPAEVAGGCGVLVVAVTAAQSLARGDGEMGGLQCGGAGGKAVRSSQADKVNCACCESGLAATALHRDWVSFPSVRVYGGRRLSCRKKSPSGKGRLLMVLPHRRGEAHQWDVSEKPCIAPDHAKAV